MSLADIFISAFYCCCKKKKRNVYRILINESMNLVMEKLDIFNIFRNICLTEYYNYELNNKLDIIKMSEEIPFEAIHEGEIESTIPYLKTMENFNDFIQFLENNNSNFDLMTKDLKEKEKINQIIKETFIIANDKLVENEEINSLFSGSTCVSVIYTPYKLIVPNIGDSRAVLGRLINKETNEYKAIELSRDHKPTEKDEAQRIIENDGRIQPFTEEGEFVGPERVWIKEEEVPGLAMTRSFGDRVAATVGVMSEPEIKEFLFEEGDKFMIIASDGIWEFISSQECVDIIKNFYDRNDLKGCCEYLYQESSKRWLKEEEVIDDTTLILVFFE